MRTNNNFSGRLAASIVQPDLHSDDSGNVSSSLQNLPDNILLLIVTILSVDLEEPYAPLICSRVCSRWRHVAIGTPSLWSLINVSRGRKLTHLWLLNSKDAPLDIQLCDQLTPLQKNYVPHMLLNSLFEPPTYPSEDPTIDDIKLHIYRWRSLDLSFSCMCRTSRILQYLGQVPIQEPLRLHSLTIGPMGQTVAVPGHGSHTVDMQSIFRNIQVQPIILQVDTIPVCSSPVFSPRLTVLRFFATTFIRKDSHHPDPSEWQKILSATPNLTELNLWHPGHGDTTSLPSKTSINLPSLRQLKLAGLFVRLSGLFARSPLPSLELLLLDSSDASGKMPQQITDIALVAPSLGDLRIGSVVFRLNNPNPTRWVEPLRALGSLKKLTFFEMEWTEITAVLEWLDVLPARPALHVRFERIHDIELDDLDRKEISGYISSTELIDCVEGGARQCSCPAKQPKCQSEDGSNYSDGSSVEYIYESTSEESTSDESEFSSEWYTTDSGDGPGN